MAKKQNEEVKEVKKEEKVDLEAIKKDLTNYVDEKIRTELVDNIEKANKKVIREKNIKIIWRDALILILLGICGFLVYTLYNIDYFDRFVNKTTREEIPVVEEEKPEEVKEEVKEPTLDELKAKYAYLLDNYVINDESSYLEDYYNGNLTNEIKNYLTLNMLDFNTITVQDDYNIISEYSFAEKYKELFNSEYENINFNYNGNNIRYLSIINSYLSTSILEHISSNIKREIIGITVKDNIVNITTIEGIVKENKLYSPVTKEEIENYNNDLTSHESELIKITYVFNDGKLDKITK